MAKRTEEAAKLAGLIARKTGAPMEGTESGDLVAVNNALQRHKMSNDHDSFDHIWSGINEFLQNLKVAGLMPIGETADIGTALRMFRKLWVSELTTLIFRKGNVLVMDGTFVLTKQSGKFAADVAAGDTQIDFGQALTVGDYLLLRAENKMEYMQVGTLVDGTTYNVTRNLDGSGANDWPRESVYFVRGHEGDGWLELTAVDEQRLSLFIQGQNWDQTTEIVRIGLLDGWQGAGLTGYGLAMGSFANGKYVCYDTTDNNFVLSNSSGAVVIDEFGIKVKTNSQQMPPIKIIHPQDNSDMISFLGGFGIGNTSGSILLFDPESESSTYTMFDIGAVNRAADSPVRSLLTFRAFSDGGKTAVFNGSIEAEDITSQPGSWNIPRAESDGKINIGWLPDLSNLYLPINGKAADAEKLDGLDSTQFELASDWLSWTPTCTGWSSYTARRGRYRVQGKTLFFVCEIRGTSNATSATVTLPAGLRSANVISTGVWPFAGIGTDNGVSLANPIRGNVANNSTVINLYKDFGGANWTASGNKQAIFSGWCEIA